MKLPKTFTFFRLYVAFIVLALSVFSYAEYYGYILTGSDENTRDQHSSYNHGARIHHK